MKGFRKCMSMILVIAMMLLIMCVPVNAATQSKYYTDVYTTDSYHDAVIYLYDHNIMVGYTSTTFAPSGNLTRAEVVTILWRMLNKPEPYGVISTFLDCDSSAYYYKAVQWACSESVGIASGYENGNFGPADLVSNQDLITFLYRFACYCEYVANTNKEQADYLAAFNGSALINKNTFWDYSKVAVGWAYQIELLKDNYIKGTVAATRGETAKYIYGFYQEYQNKYGLTVVNSTNLIHAPFYGKAMGRIFDDCGATVTNIEDIEGWRFSTAMYNAFTNAKPLDICYLYLHSHGSEKSLGLFTDSDKLYPSELRDCIDDYDGTFVVFIESCYSGVFIVQTTDEIDSIQSDDELVEMNETEANTIDNSSVMFDIDLFVEELIGIENMSTDTADILATGTNNLSGTCRIKVLASSRDTEKSAAYLAVDYWCRGSGYALNSTNESITGCSLYSDSNGDGKVSLEELFDYSYYEVLLENIGQHVVRYPENDSYIIFERD